MNVCVSQSLKDVSISDNHFGEITEPFYSKQLLLKPDFIIIIIIITSTVCL